MFSILKLRGVVVSLSAPVENGEAGGMQVRLRTDNRAHIISGCGFTGRRVIRMTLCKTRTLSNSYDAGNGKNSLESPGSARLFHPSRVRGCTQKGSVDNGIEWKERCKKVDEVRCGVVPREAGHGSRARPGTRGWRNRQVHQEYL